MTDSSELGLKFSQALAGMQYALKRRGFLQNQAVAEAYWRAFAAKLDQKS